MRLVTILIIKRPLNRTDGLILSIKMRNKISLVYIATALLALLLGMIFGILSRLQYVIPEFIKELLPFNSLRPFHVTSVIAWIILCAVGGIYYYLSNSGTLRLYSSRLSQLHYFLFLGIGLTIYYSYYTGNFGGKEYLEFPPYLILPILFGWLLFGINYYKTMVGNIETGRCITGCGARESFL